MKERQQSEPRIAYTNQRHKRFKGQIEDLHLIPQTKLYEHQPNIPMPRQTKTI